MELSSRVDLVDSTPVAVQLPEIDFPQLLTPIHANNNIVQFHCVLFNGFTSKKTEFKLTKKNRLIPKVQFEFTKWKHRCQGIKPESLNQVSYCKATKVVHMYVLEDDADIMLPYFLHRVRRIENRIRRG